MLVDRSLRSTGGVICFVVCQSRWSARFRSTVLYSPCMNLQSIKCQSGKFKLITMMMKTMDESLDALRPSRSFVERSVSCWRFRRRFWTNLSKNNTRQIIVFLHSWFAILSLNIRNLSTLKPNQDIDYYEYFRQKPPCKTVMLVGSIMYSYNPVSGSFIRCKVKPTRPPLISFLVLLMWVEEWGK